MNEAVMKYYRQLLKTGFKHAGSLENPSIVLDPIGERAINCGDTDNFINLYVSVVGNTIEDIKYQCSCEPASNVAVEILCALLKGKTLEEAVGVTEGDFFHFFGSEDEKLGENARGLLELMRKGIAQYKS